MPILYRDYETRSTLSLSDAGAWKYAGDPSTDIWCASFAVDNGPMQTWLPGQPIPPEFQIAETDPTWLIVAHNDRFESAIEERLLVQRYGWPLVPIERHRCTQAMALAAALPAKLDMVAVALGLPISKDAEGARVMREMARPRKLRPGEDPNGIYWIDDPKKLERLIAYNQRDVEVEREVYRRLPPLSDAEQILWQLDITINRRGFHVDVALAEAAHAIVQERRTAINAELTELTGGRITSIAQVNRITEYLKERGHKVAGVGKRSVSAVLAHGPDADIERLLRLRQEGGKSSVSKFDALFAMVNDNRIHDALRFHGAATGRWTGHGFQPHNLARAQPADPDAAIAAVLSADLERVAAIGPPLEVVGSLSRSMICAAPGKTLIRADFSSIEPRVLCWLAGETWKLEGFRKFDATGDLAFENYCLVASRILGRTVTPADEDGRQIGKCTELAFGYAGALGAFRKIAPDADFTDAQVETFKRQWRMAHPAIVKFWGELHRTLLRTMRTGKPEACRNLKAEMRGGDLYLILPSDRAIVYPQAHIEVGQYSDQIMFKDNTKGKWQDVRGWHGTFTENVVQAISRDLLAAAMQRLEAAGYSIVLHVHDEIVAEVAEDFGSPEDFANLMIELPPWATGLPLAAMASRHKRYAKEKNGYADADENEEPIAHPQLHCDDKARMAMASNISEAPENGANPARTQGIAQKPVSNSSYANQSHGNSGPKQGQSIARFLYAHPNQPNYLRVDKHTTANGENRYYQHHWNGHRWVYGVKGTYAETKIPYRLLELIAAPAEEAVWICEGEKDTDNVAALGLIATTNPGGAKVFQPELAQWFKGKQLAYILEDNDDAGREHTHKILAVLIDIVPNIAVVAFPELPEKGDVSYWLEIGGNKQLLIARAEQALKRRGEYRTKLQSMRASEIAMTAVEWLWPNRFAIGKLGLIVGLPEEGKGQILCYIAAQVTKAGGTAWPCDEGYAPKGNVVLLTAEDAIDDTVAPRLEAAGADRKRIVIINMVRDQGGDRMFSLHTDLAMLREKIIAIGDVVLVLIDPVSAYLGVGQVDSYRTTDVRAVLGPVVSLAAELKVAMIGIMHFNKKLDVTNVLLRISDSLAYGATARHVYGVVNDPDNHRKLVVRAKNNLAASGTDRTLAFTFSSREVGIDPNNNKPIIAPFITWETTHIDVSAVEAMQAANEFKSPTARDSAKKFLHDLLAKGPITSGEVDEAAQVNGISKRTLHRAKNDLNIITKKDNRSPAGTWTWRLPDCE
jgi:DNA polymerase